MSNRESPVDEFERPSKRRIQRRHGACEPCRASKTKCDGRIPCGACRSERRRQCPCVYSEKAMKLQQVTAEIRRKTEFENKNFDERDGSLHGHDTRRSSIDEIEATLLPSVHVENTIERSSFQQGREAVSSESDFEVAKMSTPISVCAAIDEFKRLKVTRGYSAQVVSRCDGFDVSEHVAIRDQLQFNPKVQSSASLTNLSSEPVEAQRIGAKLDIVESLVKQGHMKRAWVDLASIARQAQLLQASSTSEQTFSASENFSRLWNKILDLEAQLGLTLGQPIGLLLNRVSHSQNEIGTVSLEDSIEDTRHDLYQHIQGILGLELSSTTAIRDFLERADRILHHEPFIQVGYCTTDAHSAAVRELHLDTHLLFMVVLCRMASLCDLFSRDLTNSSWSDTSAADIIRSLSLHQPRRKLEYCRRMFRSANFIVDSFISLHHDNLDMNASLWIRCHSVYNAAIILGIAKLRHEVEWHPTTRKLTELEEVFKKLSRTHSQSYLFTSAADRLQDLNSVNEPASEATRNKHSGVKNRKRSVPGSLSTSPTVTEYQEIGSTTDASTASTQKPSKRAFGVMVAGSATLDATPQDHLPEGRSHPEDEYRHISGSHPSYDDLNLHHLSLFQDNSATYSGSETSFTMSSMGSSSSATSFSESDVPLQAVADLPINHPGPPFAFPFPYHTFHPPMTWNNPIFDMGNQQPTALPIEVPVISQFVTGTSSVSGNSGPQYMVQNLPQQINPISESLSHSDHSSPLQATTDGPMIPGSSPLVTRHDRSVVDNTSVPRFLAGCVRREQPLAEQSKVSMPDNGQPSSSVRPIAEPDPPAVATRTYPHLVHGNHQPPPNGWHRCATDATRNLHHQAPNGNPSNSGFGQNRTADETCHHDAVYQSHDAGPCFTHSLPHQPQDVVSSQSFSHDQMNLISPTTGMIQQPPFHGLHPQGTLSQYGKYYITDCAAYSHWRPVSIDAGAPSANQY